MHIATLLKKNAPLRNLHRGKRCFIVGNGPSLKQQDILPLQDEVCFVVSSFYHHPQASLINPPYWVVADPQNWNRPDDTLYPLLNALYQTGITTKLFMPSDAAPLMMQTQTGLGTEPHFYHYDWSKTDLDSLDLSAGIPPFGQNVIIPAMLIALYMGCNPIYLIGCDHTWWGFTAESYATDTSQHFYAPTAIDSRLTYQNQLSFEQLRRTIDVQRDQYQKVRTYANRHGIQIFNATEGGLLEDFPRVRFEELFPAVAQEDLPLKSVFELGNQALELVRMDRFESALALIDQGLELNYFRQVWVSGLEVLKAYCLAQLGQAQSARTMARHFLTLDAGSEAARALADSLIQGGPAPEAALLPADLLQLASPLLDPSQSALDALIALGEERFAQGELGEALECFQAALSADETSSLAENNLAVLLWQLGHQQGATRHFRRSLALDPDNRDAVLNWGEALKASGAFSQARQLCMEYLERHQDDVELSALAQELAC